MANSLMGLFSVYRTQGFIEQNGEFNKKRDL